MKVLIACEESQRVCETMRARGHEAYSADIQEPSGGHPEWHILGDVLPILNGRCSFATMDGKTHTVDGKWELIIAHPPCTYLSNAGAVRLYKKIGRKSYIDLERFNKGLDAKEFFLKFLSAECDRIAVENPIPSSVYRLPKYSQCVQPYEFGHPYSKKTCLWLKGLPLLKPTNIVAPLCSWVSAGSKKADGTPRSQCGVVHSAKLRGKTFEGIAQAMAEQWTIL